MSALEPCQSRASARLGGAALAAVLACLLLVPATALPQEIETTIDLSYKTTRDNDAGEITYSKELLQTYSTEYDVVGGYYDYSGKLEFDYDVKKATNQATTRTVSPSLDLEMSGAVLKLSGSYDGSKDFTAGDIETAAVTGYSSSYLLEAELEPERLPSVSLKWERERDFEPQATERVGSGIELDVTWEVGDLETEFKYSDSEDRDYLPEELATFERSWEGSVSYGRDFTDLLDLQVDYTIDESVSEERGREGVFVSLDKEYGQELKTSLKSGFTIPRNFDVSLSYDFQFNQDFLEEDFRHEITHKATGEVKRELLRWMEASLKYEGEDKITYGAGGEEDEEEVKNSVSGSLQAKPFEWLDVETKAEREYITSVESETGYTVDHEEKRTYETSVDLPVFGDAVKLTGTHGYEETYEEDLLSKQEVKYKFRATIQPFESLKMEPSFDISLAEENDVELGLEIFESSTRKWNAEVKFSFDKKWLDMLEVKAEHSFGLSKEQKLDEVLNLEEDVDLTEDSKFGIKISDLIRGLSLEAEVSRKATDTQDDEEPMIVDRSLSVGADWEIRDLKISASYDFDDKGDADDTLSFDTSLTWKRDFYEITGEYKFGKTFSEEIDESTEYNVKLKMIF